MRGNYRIGLGIGSVIDMDKDVYGTAFPRFKSAGINENGGEKPACKIQLFDKQKFNGDNL